MDRLGNVHAHDIRETQAQDQDIGKFIRDLVLLRCVFDRLANLFVSLPLKVLQEFSRFNANRYCEILGSVVFQPVSFVSEIRDVLPKCSNRCLFIHEKRVRVMSTFRFR